ncbi:MAG: beta-ketoacyl-[acyl-carrier-protein] synthase II, partial [Planctomycetes bacterium]|nr:beta-ketoacyl-[acyl-carrier-protein] synthase II [Planctomycetota bacterium]
MARRRVVITGLGALSSLGTGLSANWENLLRGASGAGPITRFDTSKHSCRFACEIWDWNPERHFP